MTLFPDITFIQEGRNLEVRALESGTSAVELAETPHSAGLSDEDEDVNYTSVDDVQDVEDRGVVISAYVPFARQAFNDRGLVYPFKPSVSGAALEVVDGLTDRAKAVAELSFMVSKGAHIAKSFEERATKALHRLIGGWCVCVGDKRTQVKYSN